MSTSGTEEGEELWERYVQLHNAYVAVRMQLLGGRKDLVAFVRRGLDDPSQRAASLAIAAYLSEDERKLLFADLLMLSSYSHGLTNTAIELLKTLPRSWVCANIKGQEEPLLRDGDYEQYRMLLRIYEELCEEHALELAQRALQSEDPDIREAGEDFLAKWAGQRSPQPT